MADTKHLLLVEYFTRNLSKTTIWRGAEGGHDNSHLTGDETGSPERLNKLLQFKQQVSDKITDYTCLLILPERWLAQVEMKHRVQWSVSSFPEAELFGKWFCYCQVRDLYQGPAGNHLIIARSTSYNSQRICTNMYLRGFRTLIWYLQWFLNPQDTILRNRFNFSQERFL